MLLDANESERGSSVQRLSVVLQELIDFSHLLTKNPGEGEIKDSGTEWVDSRLIYGRVVDIETQGYEFVAKAYAAIKMELVFEET